MIPYDFEYVMEAENEMKSVVELPTEITSVVKMANALKPSMKIKTMTNIYK